MTTSRRPQRRSPPGPAPREQHDIVDALVRHLPRLTIPRTAAVRRAGPRAGRRRAGHPDRRVARGGQIRGQRPPRRAHGAAAAAHVRHRVLSAHAPTRAADARRARAARRPRPVHRRTVPRRVPPGVRRGRARLCAAQDGRGRLCRGVSARPARTGHDICRGKSRRWASSAHVQGLVVPVWESEGAVAQAGDTRMVAERYA